MVTHSPEQVIFHAVAEPTRRRLLDNLSRGPRSAGHLARKFRSSRPAVAKHLRILRRARLVRVHRLGRHQIYALTPAPLEKIERWVARYQAFWKMRLEEAADSGERSAPRQRQNGMTEARRP
jgi:DNA-binding transcriptional ArsR family regulator